MACNRPIVSVQIGDVSELIAGVEGCTLVGRCINTFTDAMVYKLRYEGFSDRREALLQKGLDIISIAQRIMAFYETVLNSRKVNYNSHESKM